MPQRAFRMKLHDHAAPFISVVVLTWDERCRRIRSNGPIELRVITQSGHYLVRFRHVALAQHDVQVAEFSQSQVAIRLSSENGSFVRQRLDSRRSERTPES